MARFADTVMRHQDMVVNELGEVALWLSIGIVWTELASEVDVREVPENVIPIAEKNVAVCCVGNGLELTLKALAKVSGIKVPPSHNIKKTFKCLRREHRDEITAFVEQELRCPIDKFIAYVDRFVCHPDRRYGMIDKSGGTTPLSFGMPIDEIVKVQAKIADIVNGKMSAYPEGK